MFARSFIGDWDSRLYFWLSVLVTPKQLSLSPIMMLGLLTPAQFEEKRTFSIKHSTILMTLQSPSPALPRPFKSRITRSSSDLDTKVNDEPDDQNRRWRESSSIAWSQNPVLQFEGKDNRKGSSVRSMLLNLMEGAWIWRDLSGRRNGRKWQSKREERAAGWGKQALTRALG